MNLNNQQHRFVCELLWGSVPTDKNWAEQSSMYKTEAPKILERYPQLDKSFCEIHKDAHSVTKLEKK